MLVSVYIPTRNRRTLIERAVRSVLQQDHADIELIVVDEGSTDETPAFLAAVARADPRVVVLTNDQPRGAPAARNRAITAARGEFVTGLDDDDYFEATRIRRFVTSWKELTAKGLRPSCLYSQSISIRAGKETWVSANPETAEFADLFAQNVVGNQVFAPRDHFLGAGLFDEQLPAWQDLDLFIRILMKYGTAYLVDAPTYFYDDEDRGDRISGKAERIRAAMARISAKHPTIDRRLRFLLFMQMFNGFYDMRPGWRDVGFLLINRPSIRQVKRMAKQLLAGYLPNTARFGSSHTASEG